MNKLSKYLLFLLTFLIFSCNKDNDCDGTFTIESVLPNSNPPGAEVRIQGTGFSANPTIRFAGQVAKSSFTAEKGLTAIVPNNVSGLVDLTVEDGDCLARTEFEVLGTLPANWVAAPTLIVIPITPVNFPSSIANQWKNYYDQAHTWLLSTDSGSCDQNFPIVVNQELSFSVENHPTNKFLQENPITGVYKCSSKTLDIIVDRTKNGGIPERYIGRIIAAETIGESSSDGKTYMLLTSQTGRQYIFFTP